jgi:hypothetical protein
MQCAMESNLHMNEYPPTQFVVTGYSTDGKRVSQVFEKHNIADTTNAYVNALDAFGKLQYGTMWLVSTYNGKQQKSIVRQKTQDGRLKVR